jgi:hypothetical protein
VFLVEEQDATQRQSPSSVIELAEDSPRASRGIAHSPSVEAENQFALDRQRCDVQDTDLSASIALSASQRA